MCEWCTIGVSIIGRGRVCEAMEFRRWNLEINGVRYKSYPHSFSGDGFKCVIKGREK